MATTALAKTLAFFQEVTSGTAPADASAWASSGTRIRFITDTLDTSALVKAMIEDERSQEQVLAYDDMIDGIAGGGDIEFPYEAYLTGSGDSTQADGDSVTANDLSTILLHALGGRRLGVVDTAATAGSHTTTAVEVDDGTNYTEGEFVGLEDADGNIHIRRIQSISTNVLTFHRALPFTPSDGDLVYGCINLYITESVLVDSNGGPYTFSYLIETGLSGSREAIEAKGCATYLTGINLARNEAPKLAFSTRVGSFTTSGTAPVPTWSGTPSGAAGLNVGSNTKVFFQDRGTTTENCVQPSEISITPGVTKSPVPATTECNAGMPGLSGYSLDRAPCELSMTLPHSDTWFTNFDAGTRKQLQVERLASLGLAWSIYFPSVEITNNPTHVPIGSALGNTVTMRAHYDADDPGSDVAALWQSRMVIALC